MESWNQKSSTAISGTSRAQCILAWTHFSGIAWIFHQFRYKLGLGHCIRGISIIFPVCHSYLVSKLYVCVFSWTIFIEHEWTLDTIYIRMLIIIISENRRKSLAPAQSNMELQFLCWRWLMASALFTTSTIANIMQWKSVWPLLASFIARFVSIIFQHVHLTFCKWIADLLRWNRITLSLQALRLSQMALSETAPGKLVNLLSNDVQRFNSLSTMHPLWFSPVTTIVATYILWNEIRWAGLIGVAIILAFIPIQSNISRFSLTHLCQ